MTKYVSLSRHLVPNKNHLFDLLSMHVVHIDYTFHECTYIRVEEEKLHVYTPSLCTRLDLLLFCSMLRFNCSSPVANQELIVLFPRDPAPLEHVRRQDGNARVGWNRLRRQHLRLATACHADRCSRSSKGGELQSYGGVLEDGLLHV